MRKAAQLLGAVNFVNWAGASSTNEHTNILAQIYDGGSSAADRRSSPRQSVVPRFEPATSPAEATRATQEMSRPHVAARREAYYDISVVW